MWKKIILIILIVLIELGDVAFAQFPEFDSVVNLNSELPVTFDLRNTDRLSNVRVQAAGGCWAAAVMSSLESFMLSSGKNLPGLSDKNLFNFHGFDSIRSVYGNHLMATAYFMRRSGPMVKNAANDTSIIRGAHPEFAIDAARFLPNDPNLIKKTIHEFGAVYSMLYFRPELLDTLTFIHYSNKISINHAVCLVGWNDTIMTNTGKGVWIAQNSLGEKFGENGFFYIPYEDPNILEYNAVWPDWQPWQKNLNSYYYDTLGYCNAYGFGDTVCYGLVKFTSRSNGYLKSIGTYCNEENSLVKAIVYKSFDPENGILRDFEDSSETKKCAFRGYYTMELNQPILLSKGEDFYIQVQYSCPGDTLPLPKESAIKDYSNPHLATGKCWINPDVEKWPNTWYECGENTDYPVLRFNLCIHAYIFSEEN